MPALTSYLAYSLANSPKEHNEHHAMIKRMCLSPSLGAMSETDLSKWIKALILKIHVITGWVIPANEMLSIFLDQVRKKVAEVWHVLNPDEIEFVFRNASGTVNDWGKNMNIYLLDEVLSPYIEKKRIAEIIAKREFDQDFDKRFDRSVFLQMFNDLLPIDRKNHGWFRSTILCKLRGVKPGAILWSNC